MNVRKVYESVLEAMKATTDATVGSYLNVAIEELEAHMEKEKARVSKYRTKEYKEKKHEHTVVDGVCPTCGTNVGESATSVPDPSATVTDYAAKERAKEIENPKDTMEDALELLDEEIPKIASYNGVEDDLEGDEPDTEENEIVDDLVSILSL